MPASSERALRRDSVSRSTSDGPFWFPMATTCVSSSADRLTDAGTCGDVTPSRAASSAAWVGVSRKSVRFISPWQRPRASQNGVCPSSGCPAAIRSTQRPQAIPNGVSAGFKETRSQTIRPALTGNEAGEEASVGSASPAACRATRLESGGQGGSGVRLTCG